MKLKYWHTISCSMCGWAFAHPAMIDNGVSIRIFCIVFLYTVIVEEGELRLSVAGDRSRSLWACWRWMRREVVEVFSEKVGSQQLHDFVPSRCLVIWSHTLLVNVPALPLGLTFFGLFTFACSWLLRRRGGGLDVLQVTERLRLLIMTECYKWLRRYFTNQLVIED